ncbi:Protein involved in cell differentiation/sexual development [Plasmopara halstedii]|uniref:Protein involved in cell differentiation/sexual development n=1 Tax=Plasmopara halstedii TaxID=4781 RepID=A0A0P1AU82_PLAHL|nr:Protein involved in cell differentiation/sexual development [Plasmopara halstedii]CEG45830.1 Protein involved in cell differentiation/sexual development [Plasmopara halstedii]|eukprot:XP_024582199.1 Protein involved in cell differentiation/sexual development [Plasmopara halstedii]
MDAPEQLYSLVLELSSPEQRESALLELSKKREDFPELAPILWHSFAHASNRVCNALALLQCVASHSDTRTHFLNAHIPLYLYPFLNTVSKNRPFEYLRLTSLGVIGALVKIDDSDVINFLLQTEIIPLCLRIMEAGSELSKTVATFILQKILLDDMGLTYICHTPERFYAVGTVLSKMVTTLVEAPAPRLLKHIIRCYLRLSDNPRAKDALRQCLPDALHNHMFDEALKEDATTSRWLSQLLYNISTDATVGAGAVQGARLTS